MPYSYSPSKKGFYTSEIKYNDFPDDLIKLTDAQYYQLLFDANNLQKEIVVVNGNISTQTRPVPILTLDAIRQQRNLLLADSDYTDTLSAKLRLGDIVYDEWQVYRQKLRDIPQNYTESNSVVWPIAPKA